VSNVTRRTEELRVERDISNASQASPNCAREQRNEGSPFCCSSSKTTCGIQKIHIFENMKTKFEFEFSKKVSPKTTQSQHRQTGRPELKESNHEMGNELVRTINTIPTLLVCRFQVCWSVVCLDVQSGC
jgi:hypothetical protein